MGYKKKFYGVKMGETELGVRTNVLSKGYKKFRKSVKLPPEYKSKRNCKKKY